MEAQKADVLPRASSESLSLVDADSEEEIPPFELRIRLYNAAAVLPLDPRFVADAIRAGDSHYASALNLRSMAYPVNGFTNGERWADD